MRLGGAYGARVASRRRCALAPRGVRLSAAARRYKRREPTDLEESELVENIFNALCAAPKQLVNVRGRVSPLLENGVYTPNSVELCVEVRFASDVVNASLAQRREGFCHAGLDAAIGALLLARQKGGEAIAGLPLKTKGVCVPPRAARLGAASLRTLRGQLKALETEGTAARPPPPPDGLSVNLGEYQVETVGWMLARENSKFGIEDLFETPLGSLAVTALPTPKVAAPARADSSRRTPRGPAGPRS